MASSLLNPTKTKTDTMIQAKMIPTSNEGLALLSTFSDFTVDLVICGTIVVEVVVVEVVILEVVVETFSLFKSWSSGLFSLFPAHGLFYFGHFCLKTRYFA